ncbi:histidine kinase [Campylobacter jejuni]
MQNYKKLGIEHFYKKDFKTAKMYFSMAYEKRKNKRLLNFICLCDLALKSPKEASLLFDFYIEHYKISSIDKDLEEILSTIEFKKQENKQENEFEDGHALNYQDFLEKLLDNGYKDMTLNYIENVMPHFWANDRFIKLQEKLIGFKSEIKT